MRVRDGVARQPKRHAGTPHRASKPSACALAATQPALELRAPAPAAAAAKPAESPNAREAALRGVVGRLPGSRLRGGAAIQLLTAQFDTLAEVFAYYSKSSPVADPASPDFTLRFAAVRRLHKDSKIDLKAGGDDLVAKLFVRSSLGKLPEAPPAKKGPAEKVNYVAQAELDGAGANARPTPVNRPLSRCAPRPPPARARPPPPARPPARPPSAAAVLLLPLAEDLLAVPLARRDAAFYKTNPRYGLKDAKGNLVAPAASDATAIVKSLKEFVLVGAAQPEQGKAGEFRRADPSSPTPPPPRSSRRTPTASATGTPTSRMRRRRRARASFPSSSARWRARTAPARRRST